MSLGQHEVTSTQHLCKLIQNAINIMLVGYYKILDVKFYFIKKSGARQQHVLPEKAGKKRKKKYVLDKDIKNIILPFYVFQTIFFVRKYNISQDFLTTISRKDMLLTFIVTLLNLIMFYCAIFPILNKKMIIYAILFF